MKRILFGLLISIPLYGQVPPVEFDCDSHVYPREKCHLKNWSHAIPSLGLEDLGLPKQITYTYKGTPKYECPGLSVDLQISVSEVNSVFELTSPNTFTFVVYGNSTTTITDTNPEKTYRLPFNNECIGQFEFSQTYSVEVLGKEAKNISAQLSLVMDNVASLRELVSYFSLTDDEISKKIADLQVRVSALEGSVNELKGVADLTKIINKLKDAKKKLEDIQALNKTQRDTAQKESTEQLQNKINTGRQLVDTGLRLLKFLADDTLNQTINAAKQGL